MLQPDVDACFAEPPLKRLKNDDLPDGPKTAAAALDWVQPCLQSLKRRGLELFNVDYLSKLRETLQNGLCLRTDYSGVGGPEEALDLIFAGLELPGQLLKCQRAGDLDKRCQHVLLHRGALPGSSGPRCVRGNMLDRAPNDFVHVNVFTDLQSTCDFVFWYLFYLDAPIKNMSYDLCTPQAFLGFKTFSW